MKRDFMVGDKVTGVMGDNLRYKHIVVLVNEAGFGHVHENGNGDITFTIWAKATTWERYSDTE